MMDDMDKASVFESEPGSSPAPSVEARALELWQRREMGFPAFVRRMRPDALDHATGAWALCLKAASEGKQSC